MSKNQNNSKPKGSKERKINIILVVLLIVAVAAMSVFFFVLKDTSCSGGDQPATSSGEDKVFVMAGDFRCTEYEGSMCISKYTGADKNVTLPTEVDGKPLTKVLDYAFYENTTVESITVPEGFTDIGNRAFSTCPQLLEVSLPASVKSVDSYAFYSSVKLHKVTFACDTVSFGNAVFEDCTSLKTITLPETVTRIGRNSFNNTGLFNEKSNWKDGLLYLGNCLLASDAGIVKGEYTAPDNIKTIADWTFTENDNLTSVVFPDNVKYIGSAAVAKCKNLVSLRLPADITNVTYSIGYNCPKLDEIVLKKGVTSIGQNAFSKCTALRRAVIPASVTEIDQSAFQKCTNLTIECPAGSKAEEFAKQNNIPYVNKEYE